MTDKNNHCNSKPIDQLPADRQINLNKHCLHILYQMELATACGDSHTMIAGDLANAYTYGVNCHASSEFKDVYDTAMETFEIN